MAVAAVAEGTRLHRLLRARLPVRVLYLGDSITNAAGASVPARSYPALVTGWLRNHNVSVTVFNGSRGGWTAADGDTHARELAGRHLPDLAVVAFGVNDQKPGRRRQTPTLSLDGYRDRLTHLVIDLEVCCSPQIVLVSPPFGPYAAEYRDVCADVADRYGHTLADATEGFTGDWMAADDAHPDDNGHAFIADRVIAALE